jgi:hypothetical protein
VVRSYAIVTTNASKITAEIHDRLPVILACCGSLAAVSGRAAYLCNIDEGEQPTEQRFHAD